MNSHFLAPIRYMRSIFVFTLGIALCVSGMLIWTNRSTFDNSLTWLESVKTIGFREFDDTPEFLNELCTAGREETQALIVAVSVNAYPDDVARGYFETALNDHGMQINYDPGEAGVLKLAIASSNQAGKIVPIYTVRRSSQQLILIRLSSEGRIRIIADTIDHSVSLNPELVTQIECNATRLNTADGAKCGDCNTRLLAASGPASAIEDLMNSTSNASTAAQRGMVGSVLTSLGLLLSYRGARSWGAKRMHDGN